MNTVSLCSVSFQCSFTTQASTPILTPAQQGMNLFYVNLFAARSHSIWKDIGFSFLGIGAGVLGGEGKGGGGGISGLGT